MREVPGPTNPFVRFEPQDVEQSIPQRFEQQVRNAPDSLAVKSRTRELTYDELGTAADRVAAAILARRGARAEAVALLLEHDAPVIGAVLGVLKTGKFYVPLDPSYPPARNRFMLEDSQAGLIVTNDRNLALARELCDGIELVNVDELQDPPGPGPAGASIAPDAIAALFYTSGSTGRPKGVVQNHRNVLHEIMKYTNDFHICRADRLTHIRSFSGVGASMDIFTALLTGAALYPLDIKAVGLAPMAHWLLENEITVYHSVPTVFRHFGHTLHGDESFPKLRLVRLGGEIVDARDVQIYQRHFSRHALFLNVLGTTEVLTFRWCFFDGETRLPGSIVPVGYEVSDAAVVLLDEDGNELGEGLVGEIAIDSRYHSPGYWRLPELTATVFSPVPGGAGERRYLTGDLGRMQPGGCLLHLGRKDFQVKIRGFRVEASEVELALLETGLVREAVVTAQDIGHGDRRLVGYVVPRQDSAPTVAALREALAGTLPDYMVPSTFVLLEAMPQLPNGKLDRRALPAPDPARPDLEQSYVAPRTAPEKILAAIWAEVLRVERAGVQDDFFELGGNSLLATQVLSRVRETFRIELPLREMFDSPTIAGMVDALQRRSESAPPGEVRATVFDKARGDG